MMSLGVKIKEILVLKEDVLEVGQEVNTITGTEIINILEKVVLCKYKRESALHRTSTLIHFGTEDKFSLETCRFL